MPTLYDKDTELARERVLGLMERREKKGRPLSQKDIEIGTGISTSILSPFLKRKYDGDVQRIGRILLDYVTREDVKDEEGGLPDLPFVETRQAQTILKAWKFCLTFQRMGAVIGEPGSGKTRTLREILSRDRTTVYLKGWSRLSATGMLDELCTKFGDKSRGLALEKMKICKAHLEESGRCLIFDDAHEFRLEALNTIRYLYDETGVGILLMGNRALERKYLTGKSEETEQLARRVWGRMWRLPAMEEEDIESVLTTQMDAAERGRAMALLRQDPAHMASTGRIANILEMAGLFARRNGGAMTVECLRKAMKAAA